MRIFIGKAQLIGFMEYLMIFLVIIQFQTPYIESVSISSIVNVLILFSSICLILINGVFRVNTVLFMYLFGALIPLVNVLGDNVIGYCKLYILFFSLAYIYMSSCIKTNKGVDLLFKFSDITIIIAMVSLFFWIFGSLLGIISSTAMQTSTWGGLHYIPSYYGLYFETQLGSYTTDFDVFCRNSGIFCEAPMYNFVLCTALGIELFLRRNVIRWRIILLVATILTTISTTGFFYLIFVLSYKIYSFAASKIKTIFVLFLAIILSLIVLYSIQFILDAKLQTGEGSYNSRLNDIVKCIEVGMENPVLGVGLYNEETRSDWGYSNSLFTIFARGGLYLLSIYVFAYFIIPVYVYKRNKQIAGFLIGFAILFTFTIMYDRYLNFIMLSYCLSLFFEDNKKTDRMTTYPQLFNLRQSYN